MKITPPDFLKNHKVGVSKKKSLLNKRMKRVGVPSASLLKAKKSGGIRQSLMDALGND